MSKPMKDEVMSALPLAIMTLAEFYGPRFTHLTDRERRALARDVAELMDDEGLYSRQAIQTLDRRIGNALESYVKCIVQNYQD